MERPGFKRSTSRSSELAPKAETRVTLTSPCVVVNPEPDRGPLTPRRQDDSEVLVQLDDGHELPLGLRVQTFIVGQT